MEIMVTLDGSSFAEAVVEPAAQLARESKLAEVYLVRVVDPSDAHSTVIGAPEYEGTLRIPDANIHDRAASIVFPRSRRPSLWSPAFPCRNPED
jgi:nucleotide-binding universal stress UspA family protein